MLTLRLRGPGHVAHVAFHGSHGWQSRCSQLWEGSEWIDGEQHARQHLVARGDWLHRHTGHELLLDGLAELPITVKLCTRCVARVQADADQLAGAVARRTQGAPCPPS